MVGKRRSVAGFIFYVVKFTLVIYFYIARGNLENQLEIKLIVRLCVFKY
jgi:hypothetical protein